jgi:hypothetical protein
MGFEFCVSASSPDLTVNVRSAGPMMKKSKPSWSTTAPVRLNALTQCYIRGCAHVLPVHHCEPDWKDPKTTVWFSVEQWHALSPHPHPSSLVSSFLIFV